MPETARFDAAALAERVDLRTIIADRLGPARRGGRWVCPWHDGAEKPHLGVDRDGRRFKCWRCGEAGDVYDFLMKYDRIDFIEAARQLDPSIPGRDRSTNRPTPAPAPRTAKPNRRAYPWESPEWQAEADRLVVEAEARLWSAEGRPALDWLRGRGLTDLTIRMFRLGFIADEVRSAPLDVLGGKPIWAPRGIVIPQLAPGAWFSPREVPVDDQGEVIPRWAKVNVRRLHPDVSQPWSGSGKCGAFAGSENGHGYPYVDLTAGVDVLIAEGEVDALIAFQALGHRVNVVTTGGVNNEPTGGLIDAMLTCPWWLVATDWDDEGEKAADRWRARMSDRTRRLDLPLVTGKDIGDYVESGGHLGSWLDSELIRLGIDQD